MPWIFVQGVGTAAILLALIDIYLVVLYPRSRKGWVSVSLGKTFWKGFRLLGNLPFWEKSVVLSYCGPTLLVAIVSLWMLLLVTGFALVFWPALGSGITISEGPTPQDFWTSFYYSGSLFTTVGPGDLFAKALPYRLLGLLESALGFATFTLTITYLLAIYNALAQRNIFALSLHHQTARTACPIEMLARLGAGEDFNSARDDLGTIARDLLNLLESHHAYPIIHYFHFQETYYSLARISLLTMDIATLIRTVLDEEKYRSLVHSTAVAELGNGGHQLLTELSRSFVPSKTLIERGQPEVLLWAWYDRAVERLNQEGIHTNPDREQGGEFYICLRRRWEPLVMAIAEYMAHSWAEIAPSEMEITAVKSEDSPLQNAGTGT